MVCPLIYSELSVGGHSRSGPDIKKVGNGFDSGVEDKSASAGANIVSFAGRALQSMRRQQARHAKECLAEAILEDAFVVWKNQRITLSDVDVEIEQEATAVPGRDALESIRDRFRIAVGRVAIRHVQYGWRKAGRVFITPLLKELDCQFETGAHRRLASASRLEPNGKSHRLLGHITIGSGDLFGATLHTERRFSETRNGVQRVAIQLTAKTVANIFAPIGDDANVKVVAHPVGLRTAGDDRIESFIEYIG